MFAAAIVPLILAVGIGIDIARQVSARNALQDAVDATALALAHNPSDPNLSADALTWVKANLKNLHADTNINGLTVTATTGPGDIVVTASGSVNTTLMALAGIKQETITATSTADWSRLEIALVLDNTGSMNTNNKLQTLISASQQLVATLFKQASNTPNSLKVSVVPFSMTVNVGPQYQNASWMTGALPPAYAQATNAAYPNLSWPNGTDIFSTSGVDRFKLLSQIGASWAGCVESRPAPYDVQETPPDPSNPATLFVPFFAPDEPSTWSSWYSGQYAPNYPNSYLTSDGTTSANWLVQQSNTAKYNTTYWPRNTLELAPWGGATNYQMGPNAGCALIPLLRLTGSQTAVQNELGQMVAIGDTNLAMGMIWGWHTLSPYGPFGDGAAYNTPNVNKVIVFLTDGWNQSAALSGVTPDQNDSYYSGIGYIWQNRIGLGAGTTAAQREAALDARTTLVCSNIHKVGITVYTVRIDVPNTQSPAVLQSCASSADKFYDVPNPADLSAAFTSIAQSIGNLRVAH